MVSLKSRSDSDVAWAAGLFEGEGTVVSSNRDRSSRVRVVMNDLDVLQSLNTVFPGHMRSRLNAQGKTQYVWERCEAGSVIEFIEAIMPYMHDRRTERLRAVLPVAHEVKAARGICRNGHKIEGENNQNGACRECAKAQKRSYYKARREKEIAAKENPHHGEANPD